MDTAATQAGELDQNRIAGILASQDAAGLERELEQQRNTAVYNALLQELLFPYEQALNIATALLGHSPTMVTTGGGLTDLGFAASTLSEMN